MAVPVPVSLLTGFLGSGKTTLLNRLLKEPALADTAVVINEFGEVAIDHLLVERASDGVIELSDGCVCCTVRGELVDTLLDLARRMPALKRVIVETTGLADPAPVLQSLMAHPGLLDLFRLDGVIATVDAVNGDATLDRHEEAVRQVAMADRIVLTKSDITKVDGSIESLRGRLRQLNPGAPILESGPDRPPASELLDCGLYDPTRKIPDVERWLRAEAAPDHHNHHHGHAHHDHEGHHHDSRIRTVSLIHDRPIPFGAIEAFLDILRSANGERLLRMKGIVELAEDPERPLVLHGVQKVLHPPARLPAWPDSTRGTRLVLITMDMDEDYVRRLFAAMTGMPAADMPDRAAIEDNPLAIAGVKL
ncbi:CobW family GTP-binding protein [Mesorhizobium koreense]|uniref:CobW family GTP-binding protein n=1 Tax=Mesorhizobium koreense TaxID=3074855 RepID=UPI00287BC75A|nr:GTP-binding protein [Mesorhizobium sp. WR6]